MELASIFAAMVKEEASDLFCKVGVPPAMRVVGRVISMGGQPLTEENMLEIFNEVCDDFAKKKFSRGMIASRRLRDTPMESLSEKVSWCRCCVHSRHRRRRWRDTVLRVEPTQSFNTVVSIQV